MLPHPLPLYNRGLCSPASSNILLTVLHSPTSSPLTAFCVSPCHPVPKPMSRGLGIHYSSTPFPHTQFFSHDLLMYNKLSGLKQLIMIIFGWDTARLSSFLFQNAWGLIWNELNAFGGRGARRGGGLQVLAGRLSRSFPFSSFTGFLYTASLGFLIWWQPLDGQTSSMATQDSRQCPSRWK